MSKAPINVDIKISRRDIFISYLAEMEGFEPPIQFPVYAISSRAHSTSSATSPKTPMYYTQTYSVFKGYLFRLFIRQNYNFSPNAQWRQQVYFDDRATLTISLRTS